MNQVRIAILCNDDRSELLAQTIANQGVDIIIHRWMENELYEWNNQLNSWNPKSRNDFRNVELLFQHTGDELEDNKPRNITFKRVAKFTSPGQPRVAEGECPINPPFSGKDCPITPDDVNEFIDWVEGRRAELPSISTRKTFVPQYLPALTILCQGYLIAHAEYDKSTAEWRPESIRKALDLMGWLVLVEKSGVANIQSRIPLDARSKVTAENWFGDIFKYPEAMRLIEDEWKKTQNETKLPDALKKLVNAFESRKVLPEIVAKAYCSIAEGHQR